ncbi:MAG: glycosyltransferase [Nitrospinae bacterium]|nr:glycosyltransferase [Nitrospinota bacterium]
MKILFLAPQPFFETRGTPINVRLILQSLSALGHRVDLLCYPHGDDETIPGVTIHRVVNPLGVGPAPIGPSGKKIWFDLFMFPHAFWLMLTRRPQVIHGVEEAGFMAWLLAKLFRVPYVFDMDSHIADQLATSKLPIPHWGIRLVEKMEGAALASATRVLTVCQALSDVAARYTTPDRIVQIEDIPQEYPPAPEGLTPASIRAELGIPADAPVALYTGNLETYQGIDLVMEAAPLVVAGAPDARIVIVGGGGEGLARYRQQVEQAGLSSSVLFAGARPLSHMPVLYVMADVLLSPRLTGTNTPLKIYSYLATGKAIVATDLATHTQALTPTVAKLAPPEKVAFTDALLLLLKDRELRDSLGAAGRRLVEERYNRPIFTEKIDRLYRAIADSIH